MFYCNARLLFFSFIRNVTVSKSIDITLKQIQKLYYKHIRQKHKKNSSSMEYCTSRYLLVKVPKATDNSILTPFTKR